MTVKLALCSMCGAISLKLNAILFNYSETVGCCSVVAIISLVGVASLDERPEKTRFFDGKNVGPKDSFLGQVVELWASQTSEIKVLMTLEKVSNICETAVCVFILVGYNRSRGNFSFVNFFSCTDFAY